MATFLFNEIIFGPIKSRRLGISLGVNLLPLENKFCNFNCIYCECGWTPTKPGKLKMFGREEVAKTLELKLQQMQDEGELPDVITFAGNGEPTLHKQFPEIIDDTIKLRNKWAPNARVAVLTNGTLAFRKGIFEALNQVDDNIIKLDGGTEETIKLIDKPIGRFDLNKYVEDLKAFESQLVVQTMFLEGVFEGKHFNNATEEEVSAWLLLLQKIRPRLVMLYSIDRDTPAEGLEKIPKEKLLEIAEKVEALGIKTQVSG